MENITSIVFDLDGTIVDFYSVKDWLIKLRKFDPSPYREAAPLVNLSRLARRLNSLQKAGYKIGIISWGSKVSTIDYLIEIREAKLDWLAKHMPSVNFDEVIIVPYGTPKSEVCPFDITESILFDDEEQNRTQWGGQAFSEKEIFEILKSLN